MPHGSRKKKSPPARRIQILDTDGWTHIASTRATTSRPRPPKLNEGQITPAEIPDGLTFEKLKEKYDWHKQRWVESESWAAIEQVLKQQVSRDPGTIYNCVCIGLGSPSGLSRGGWVDRRSISMFQLAALELILEFLGRSVELCSWAILGKLMSILQSRIPHEDIAQNKMIDIEHLYAQDPVFNHMDNKLLRSIGFKVVQDPEAFSKVGTRTFLYAPGAEKVHLADLFARDPVVFFGNSFDDIHAVNPDEDTHRSFSQKKSSLLLPEFEPNPSAFWKMALYWTTEEKRSNALPAVP
ncbi:predicted protein [Uncinocarpus reesii 1704]|uniref:SRR1-like domain-containing protein n=1 Tax=Uncinocarpus reesii (strain UAMH 1704) TaxID=336963 RepID=C4JLK8_UNCRE|nr:uncharacterized protein UREG_03716 [Uncinocarpus reesii 1704]EEP78870.1 predicted protein [Uncinocarpus reesii 1704]